MTERKLKTAAIIIAAASISLFILFYLFGFPSCALTVQAETPEERLELFFTALYSGDYEAANECLYNCSDMGFADPQNSEYAQYIDALSKSRQYRIIDTEKLSANKVVLNVEITTLDFKLLDNYMQEKLPDIVERFQIEGRDINDVDKLRAMLLEYMSSLTESPQELSSSREYSIVMYYSDTQWKLFMTDELYSALIGYAL